MAIADHNVSNACMLGKRSVAEYYRAYPSRIKAADTRHDGKDGPGRLHNTVVLQSDL
jgi:hypothetical protein